MFCTSKCIRSFKSAFVPQHAGKKLEEKRVPTPVFDNLLTLDPNANMPDVDFGDTEKLKM